MATLSFRKLSSTASFPTSGMTEGTIYFCPKDHTIGIATSATNVEKYYGGNVKDAVYDSKAKTLTVSYNDGTAPAVLDFSDMASADAVKKELDSLKALHAVASTDGSGKKTYKTVAAEITDALAGLSANVSGNYISAVSQTNGKVTATAKSFDAEIPADNPSASTAPTTAAVKTYVDGKVTSNTSGLKYEDTAVDGQYVSAVSQENGKIAVTRAALPTLNTAIDKAGTTTDGNAPTSGAVKDYVAAEIGTAKTGLTFTDNVTGDFVTKVNQSNGVVNPVKASFATSIAADSKSKVAPTSEAVAAFVKSQLSSLGNALHFRGAGTNAEMTALTTPADGDIFIINSGDEKGKEYVYSSGAWVELGDEGKAAALINGLNKSDTAVDGQYVSEVDQTNGVIAPKRTSFAADVATGGDIAPKSSAVKTYVDGKINALDLGQVGAAGQYVSAVSQADGKVTASATAFDTAISATSTDNNAPTSKAVYTAVNALNTTIAGLNRDSVGAAGKYISGVSQANGLITAVASDFDTVIDDTTKDSKTAPTTAAVKTYVDTKSASAVTDAISNLYTGDNKETPTPLAAGNGKFVSSVGQQNGKISIGATAFNTVIDTSTATSDIAPTTKAVKDYIDGLDVPVIGGPSKIITSVAQADGKVQATVSDVDKVIDTSTAVDPTPNTIHIPTTKAVKTYVDTEVSKAVGGALVWASWE